MSSKAPSNEQIKKDIKKDADNIAKKGKEESEHLKKQGKEAVDEASEKGKEFIDQANKKGKELLDEANDKSKEFLKEARKELNHLEEEGQNLLSQFVAYVKSTANSIGQSLNKAGAELQLATSAAVSRTSVELQNPVVIAQIAVAAGGAAAGYLAYLERYRINTDNKYVVGIHASIITGLVVLDGYLFSTYYPKYDKKVAK